MSNYMWLVEQEQENNKLKSKRIRELEAINAELEKVASYSLLRKNERLEAELQALRKEKRAAEAEAGKQISLNSELQAELQALRKLTLKLWLNSGGSRQSFDHAMKGGRQ